MDILEQPLEAVAFRLYSLPDASAATGAAAWTCLAAVLAAAAAAGLWRLRSSTPAASTAALNPLELDPSNAKVVSLSPETASTSARSPDSATSTPATPSPKERYTAYYRDCVRVGCCDEDDEEEDNEEEEEAEEQDEDDGGGGVYRTPETTTDPFRWEVVRSLPLSPTAAAAEMGRYRSPTPALSGSVVRLWDEAFVGVTAAAASPRRRSRVVGAVSAF